METSLLRPLVGAIFMGLGAGFLTYSFGDKFKRKNRKKRPTTPEGFYDPSKDDDNDNRAKMLKAIYAGFALGIMSFIYFANK